MSKQYRKLKSVAMVAMALLGSGLVTAQELTITSFKDGYLSWTNINPNLYYTIEYKPNLSETSPAWDGSHRVSQDVKSTNAIISVPAGCFYRVVGSTNPMHTLTLSPSSVTMAAGYYAATNLAQVDADLTAGNIATNVTLFGIAGTLSTNNGTVYERIVRLSGEMNYGNVATGTTRSATLTIWNDGDCAMTVSGVQYSDNSYSGHCAGKVAAGGSTNVTVTFAPLLEQGYSGTITVNSDYTRGTNTMACTGTGVDTLVRYVDNGDGTVTDIRTGLMWTKDANHGYMDWASAVAYCDNLVTNGYSDWRLPSVDRVGGTAALDTLFRANGNPSGTWEGTSGTPFTSVQLSWYWSSTTWAEHPTGWAWHVTMYDGIVSPEEKIGYSSYVWPVRGGQ
ncbi:MAG: DUF1566 domain-containing protein [bacterium]